MCHKSIHNSVFKNDLMYNYPHPHKYPYMHVVHSLYASQSELHLECYNHNTTTCSGITGKQGLKYSTVMLTDLLRNGSSENSVMLRHSGS